MNYGRQTGTAGDECCSLGWRRATFRGCGAVPCPVSRFCHFWSVTFLFLSVLTAKMLRFVDRLGEDSSDEMASWPTSKALRHRERDEP